MFLRTIPGEYAVVSKVDVRDLSVGHSFYEAKLGFVLDPRFSTETWRQYNAPGIRGFALGLNLSSNGGGSGSQATTVVVSNIEVARNALISLGVDVGPIEDAGKGVRLAFFKDPDGNALGLRQNGSLQPGSVGAF